MRTENTKMVHFLSENRRLKIYVLLIMTFFLVSYATCIFMDSETVGKLGEEDGLFEWLTAVFFLAAAILYFKFYLLKKKVLLLLFSLAFLIGFGEEISWGQRILNYKTPTVVKRINVQKEFNIHNLELFNRRNSHKELKTGADKFFTISFQYKFFWLVYGVLLPVLNSKTKWVAMLAKKYEIPVPPFGIGMFFAVNWVIYKGITGAMPLAGGEEYYSAVGEIMEAMSAFLFMMLGLYFLYNRASHDNDRIPS